MKESQADESKGTRWNMQNVKEKKEKSEVDKLHSESA